MSVYIINGLYIFNEGTRELKISDNGKVIKLTKMRARCLIFFIEHAEDDVIEKSAISYALWGARSPFTSDASLTQTLYLIRRDLKALGLDELFITVPKSGIRVNTSVSIDVLQKKNTRAKISCHPILLSLISLMLLIVVGVYFTFLYN